MAKMFSLQKEILILKPASSLFGEEYVIKESTYDRRNKNNPETSKEKQI